MRWLHKLAAKQLAISFYAQKPKLYAIILTWGPVREFPTWSIILSHTAKPDGIDRHLACHYGLENLNECQLKSINYGLHG